MNTYGASREPPSSKSRGQTIIIFEELTKSKRLFKGSRCQTTWNAAASAPPIVSWFSSLFFPPHSPPCQTSLPVCVYPLDPFLPLLSVLLRFSPRAFLLLPIYSATYINVHDIPQLSSVVLHPPSFRFLFRLFWLLHFFPIRFSLYHARATTSVVSLSRFCTLSYVFLFFPSLDYPWTIGSRFFHRLFLVL